MDHGVAAVARVIILIIWIHHNLLQVGALGIHHIAEICHTRWDIDRAQGCTVEGAGADGRHLVRDIGLFEALAATECIFVNNSDCFRDTDRSDAPTIVESVLANRRHFVAFHLRRDGNVSRRSLVDGHRRVPDVGGSRPHLHRLLILADHLERHLDALGGLGGEDGGGIGLILINLHSQIVYERPNLHNISLKNRNVFLRRDGTYLICY